MDSQQIPHAGPICIASSSGSLSSALELSAWPAQLHAKHPDLSIYGVRRGFNSYVLRGNPHVKGVKLFASPQSVVTAPLQNGKPEIFLTDSERNWAERILKRFTLPDNERLPVCVLHPWDAEHKSVGPVEFWDRIVSKHQKKIRFWQVGMIGQSAVQGCEYYLLFEPHPKNCRKLFALMSLTQAFIGVKSAPSLVAKAWTTPSIVLEDHSEASLVKTEQLLQTLKKNG